MATGRSGGDECPFEKYRGYLRALVEARLARERLRAKLDASDVVQETLIEAHRDRGSFRGTSEGERVSWISAILARNLSSLFRRFRTRRRDAALEVSLEAELSRSSDRLLASLAAWDDTPSEQAMRAERVERLSEALDRLTADQRTAILLHHCKGWPLEAIAAHTGRSVDAVASLVYRGVVKLRGRLRDPSS